ncbi:MAG TPA: DUF6766 family protein [Thermoleophilaceae bacterium]|nr:DUF6766 family protein [Thermoleophilaceae bacterium]
MRALRHNGLSAVFFGLFAVALAGQAVAGHAGYNNDEVAHAELTGEEPEKLSLARYVVSSHFGQAVMENWQSEYLQFTLFVLLTVWLIQRGSPESKEPGKAGLESDREQMVGAAADDDSPRWARVGGLRTAIYSNSLLITMGAIFLASWFAHSVTGWSSYNADQLEHGGARLGWLGYVGTAEFWETTLQNWQSEFLAVGSMVVLSIYLRQRGSPESKPVGAPHDATGLEG